MHSCGRYRLEWKFLTNEKDSRLVPSWEPFFASTV
jgi:hypothetical protein